VIRLSGRLRSSLIIGLQGIRSRKLRTLLSMVSLFLGVLAVVVVQAGAEIGQRALLSNVELSDGVDGTRRGFLPATTDSVPVILDTLHGRTDAVAMSSMQAIIGEPGVTPVNPGGAPFDQEGYFGSSGPAFICDSRGNCYQLPETKVAAPPGQAIELRLTALTGDVRAFRPFRVVSGRWLDFSGPQLAPRIVVNLEAAKGFARYTVPAEMRIPGATANPTPQIIGVIDDGSPTPTAYAQLNELLNWFPDARTSVTAYNGGLQLLLAPTATDLEQIMQARLAAVGVDSNQFGFETINTKERLSTTLALLRWIFLGMAMLVLLIGVAGILNVGLATVGERIEEFALRRAVGTPRLLLAGIVLAETLITGLLTAGAAIAVAAFAVKVVSAVLGGRQPILADLTFPWQAGLAGIIAGLVAGLLGGFVPAIRAARIPIATVMRA
jgi:putative ABC transport system permease protein